MARYPQMDGSIAPNVYEEHLYKLRVLFGSSVVTSYKSKDATLVRNSAGNYTITLPKAYGELTSLTGTFLDASGAILFFVGVTDTIATDGKLIVEARTETGVATDPASGDKLFIQIGVSDSPLNAKFGG